MAGGETSLPIITGDLPENSNQPISFNQTAGEMDIQASLPAENALMVGIESSTRSMDTGNKELLVVGTKHDISELEKERQKLEVKVNDTTESLTKLKLESQSSDNDEIKKLKSELDNLYKEMDRKDKMIAELKKEVEKLKGLTKDDINGEQVRAGKHEK